MIRHWSAKCEKISHGIILPWDVATPSVPTASLIYQEGFSASSIFGSYHISRSQQYQWTASLIHSRSTSEANVEGDEFQTIG